MSTWYFELKAEKETNKLSDTLYNVVIEAAKVSQWRHLTSKKSCSGCILCTVSDF